MGLPNFLYIPLFIKILAAILIYCSLLRPWTVNEHVTDILTVRHEGGLTYYANTNDFGIYKLSTFIRYINSNVYFMENEDKPYHYRNKLLIFCCIWVAFQFIILISNLIVSFFQIRIKSKLLEKFEEKWSGAFFFVNIAYIGVSCLGFISTIVGIVCITTVGFTNETQDQFTRKVGTGFLLHLFGTIFQIIGCLGSSLITKFVKPKYESKYDAF